MEQERKIISLGEGDSLKFLEGKVSFENPTQILIKPSNRNALIIELNKKEAVVLYRERQDENQPSRGYLRLKDYVLFNTGIWSKDMLDYKDENSDWGDLLRRFKI